MKFLGFAAMRGWGRADWLGLFTIFLHLIVKFFLFIFRIQCFLYICENSFLWLKALEFYDSKIKILNNE
ncbi:MAG: hypothetical protein BGN96_11160 [Bacteroidales bacterium 45-6]|nr:MAG: hypothetical protein BGN96_11160 [Bacteroidales bacterium 45-6]